MTLTESRAAHEAALAGLRAMSRLRGTRSDYYQQRRSVWLRRVEDTRRALAALEEAER